MSIVYKPCFKSSETKSLRFFPSLSCSGLLCLSLMVLLVGCRTTGSDSEVDPKERKPITEEMPLKEAIELAVNQGDESLDQVRRLIKKRDKWSLASNMLEDAISRGILNYQPSQLENAVRLYISAPVMPKSTLFVKLVRSGREQARRLGWRLAASKPSNQMGTIIDLELSRALIEGEEENYFYPEMADAVRINRLKRAYSFVRLGLMAEGHEAFAYAMATLEPKQSAADFLDYLALADPMELRQLTFKSVELSTVVLVLKHLASMEIDVAHRSFPILFAYGVSRNTAVGEFGRKIVENHVAKHGNYLAAVLVRQPEWLQVATIENYRRDLSTQGKVLLTALQKITPNQSLVADIRAILR